MRSTARPLTVVCIGLLIAVAAAQAAGRVKVS